MSYYSLILIGLCGGLLAGLFGVGGGIILIPLLIFFYKMPQHTANGTSLVALLLPVGIFAVLEYYKAGKIGGEHIKAGLIIAIGMSVGAYLSAHVAVGLPQDTLRKAFSLFLIAVAVKFWFF